MMKDQFYYQSLIANRAAVSVDEISIACSELQQLCNWHHDDISSLKLLEQLLLVYYEKLYPFTFGGIFEPLTKTIGYTHCLYLDAYKFPEIPQNQFWMKFNMYTNWIEDLPVELQPTNLGDLLHVLHLVSYIKNNYFDKHVAPLTFSNKKRYVGGLFELHNDRLVINLADDDAYKAFVSQEYILPYNACDIIIDNREKFPSLKYNKKLFVDYLNIWGNEALKEIVFTEVRLPDFHNVLSKKNYTLQIGEDILELKNEFSNIHFTKGLINLQTDTGKPWDETIQQFQGYLNEYNQMNDHFDEVFFVSNKLAGLTDAAFFSFNGELRDLMKQRYHWGFHDYSVDQYVGTMIPSPDMIVDHLVNTVYNSPGKRILFALGLHGQNDGSATYAGGPFLRQHFEQIFTLSSHHPHLQLLIMSCWSAKKTNKMIGNIIMNSSDQVSYVSYTDKFVQAYKTGKTLYQAHLQAMINYHQSLLPTSYINSYGELIELCPIASDFHGKPAGT